MTSNGQASEHILQFFVCDHLPPGLQAVALAFASLAHRVMELPRNPERTVALRKLLEARDAAVRAALAEPDTAGPRMAQPDAVPDHARECVIGGARCRCGRRSRRKQ